MKSLEKLDNKYLYTQCAVAYLKRNFKIISPPSVTRMLKLYRIGIIKVWLENGGFEPSICIAEIKGDFRGRSVPVIVCYLHMERHKDIHLQSSGQTTETHVIYMASKD